MEPHKLLLEKTILIFTDGAAKGNPGPGGWGAILIRPDGQVEELGRGYDQVTNNQMELEAVITALQRLAGQDGKCAVLTDSTYVIQGITEWIWGWTRNGWQTAAGDDVKNKDRWQRLAKLVNERRQHGGISWHYVRGHQGTGGNERADQIASDFAQGKRVELYRGPLLRYEHDVHDIPEDTSLPDRRRDSKATKKKAFSYLSLVGGELQIHKTWSECEARVKGRSGAKFKKAMSKSDELAIQKEWGLL